MAIGNPPSHVHDCCILLMQHLFPPMQRNVTKRGPVPWLSFSLSPEAPAWGLCTEKIQVRKEQRTNSIHEVCKRAPGGVDPPRRMCALSGSCFARPFFFFLFSSLHFILTFPPLTYHLTYRTYMDMLETTRISTLDRGNDLPAVTGAFLLRPRGIKINKTNPQMQKTLRLARFRLAPKEEYNQPPACSSGRATTPLPGLELTH
ncbi:hypothetical protein B0I35DRAFT_203074 [Stachybotrys elegans]|uniref:Uncharacterized protein n=1 Tax=Stachybotrys elegans TaxID=80388 RepID=A0A8K0SSR6_9HYPO|nr:hypothetical protein B0I35DRAFT_203074 [Stachybotrys elegans]